MLVSTRQCEVLDLQGLNLRDMMPTLTHIGYQVRASSGRQALRDCAGKRVEPHARKA